MQRIWKFLLDTRTLIVLGVLALIACVWLGADVLDLGVVWIAGLAIGLLSLWLGVWAFRFWLTRKASKKFEAAMDQAASAALAAAPKERRAELAVLRERMQQAVNTIKGSKLGGSSAALYELPWYAVIGNPAAGKSSAIVSSGLKFPFTEKLDGVFQGVGGTRNCDWFFTSEGILLDTAGRYSVQHEDRAEWLGFLSLLKRHRSKAPLNGVIIAASLAEMAGSRPEFAMDLAKQLRQRVQELTEQLEVFVPVYVVFTKADLIAGFVEFFGDQDSAEREKVWGATLPYNVNAQTDVAQIFEEHFDELTDGLKEASITRLALHRGAVLPSGVLSFPLEFASLKTPLRTFLTTLFEDNPYQFKPIFRGFYFTSSLQQGRSTAKASQRVAKRFGLAPQEIEQGTVVDMGGFFLKDLFSKVIFADRNLVQQYSSQSKIRLRFASFLLGMLMLGTCLAGWTWSYMGNRQLLANVQADLDQVVRLQDQRIDLQSRLQALEVLQDRLEQLRRYRTDRPWGLSFGLYQGQHLEAKLRSEYMAGLREVLLKPTAASMESYLQQVNAKAAQLQPLGRAVEGQSRNKASMVDTTPGVYVAASPTDVSDAYNALKAYIMLGERVRMENAHLGDQITRFWRTWLEANRGAMPREHMLRSAGSVLSFGLSEVTAADFPEIQTNLALLDTTRENLRRVVKGMPARERVYAEIKARAATRFPAVTVARLLEDGDKDVVSGSYAIPGTFTKQAWQGFVDGAIQQAANKETRADDWVLRTALQDDLTLEGSPEQIRKTLVDMYKTEYVAEWQKFMQGVSVNSFNTFGTAVTRVNRLGDPVSSPIGRLIQALYEQTSWDNPGLVAQQVTKNAGFVDWFKQTVLRMTPPALDIKLDTLPGQLTLPMGAIGREFANLSRLMVSPDSNGPTLMRNYLQALSKIRTRFNQIENAGDAGPASRQLMVQTLDGTSELAEAYRLVDEQMLVNQSAAAKATLRPLLVRPLTQAFAVIVPPAEAEINRAWSAQVHQPFLTQLASKYPFEKTSRLDATSAEISKIFGSEGVIAKFNEQNLQNLVVRRGDQLVPRTWADLGIRLQPAFTAGFPAWIAPVPTAVGANPVASGATLPATSVTQFQLMPIPSPDMSEFTIEIDGQVLRYRNTTPNWASFVWPNSQGRPGVQIVGTDNEGRTTEFLNEPGGYGLERMLASAKSRKLANGDFELSWTDRFKRTVSVQLRIISNASGNSRAGSQGTGGMPNPPSVSGVLLGTTLPSTVVGDGSSSASVLSPGAKP